jgi:hypothetical protein
VTERAAVVSAGIAPAYISASWRDWDRAAVLAAIEEAAGEGLAVNDPLPDSLIAQGQALGLEPWELRMWIYEQPKPDWSMAGLAHWAVEQKGAA